MSLAASAGSCAGFKGNVSPLLAVPSCILTRLVTVLQFPSATSVLTQTLLM